MGSRITYKVKIKSINQTLKYETGKKSHGDSQIMGVSIAEMKGGTDTGLGKMKA